MTRNRIVLLIAAFASLATVRADEPVVFRSDVSLVRVDAQVVDRDNRVISGLGPRDFSLREQGRPQAVQSVDSEHLPIDLVLLLDVSASMRPHVQRVAAASHEAMRQLREQDRVAIMVFDRSTRTRLALRSSQSGVDRELERVLDYESFRGGTDITRGLMDAADYIRREGRREARKAIVIVTDDQTEMDRNVEGVESALTRADAVLMALIAPDAMANRGMRRDRDDYPGGGYPGGGAPGGPLGGIIFGSPRQRRGYPGGGQMGSHTRSAGTEEIARASGGDSAAVNDSYALQDTIERIRQSYAVYFAAPPGVRAGEERQIDLELTDAAYRRYPGGQVHYRRTYYAQNTTPGSGALNSEPAVESRDGRTRVPDDPDRPRLQRRPGVSQVPDRSREGPLGGGGTVTDTAPAPAQQAAPAPPAPRDPNAPGWRKARPDEVPPN